MAVQGLASRVLSMSGTKYALGGHQRRDVQVAHEGLAACHWFLVEVLVQAVRPIYAAVTLAALGWGCTSSDGPPFTDSAPPPADIATDASPLDATVGEDVGEDTVAPPRDVPPGMDVVRPADAADAHEPDAPLPPQTCRVRTGDQCMLYEDCCDGVPCTRGAPLGGVAVPPGSRVVRTMSAAARCAMQADARATPSGGVLAQ